MRSGANHIPFERQNRKLDRSVRREEFGGRSSGVQEFRSSGVQEFRSSIRA
jgi:hypothetical protein